MEYVIVFVVIVVAAVIIVFMAQVIWAAVKGVASSGNPNVQRTSPSSRVALDAPKDVRRAIPQSPINLTTDDGIRSRVAGSKYWITDDALRKFAGTVFYLRRDPENEFDTNAIELFAGERKIGYVPATQAEKYAPLLDQLGAEFVVARDAQFYAGDEFYLPRIPALRKMIGSGAKVFDRSQYPTLTTSRPVLSLPSKEHTGGHPKVGGPHRNGDRIYGYQSGYARDLAAAGTPTVSKLVKRTISPQISDIRIGDKLHLVNNGGKLWAEKEGQPIGQLSWNWDHLSGIMEVQRVFISHDNVIVNCAGIAIPDKY